jgi:hypothetical protein
MSINVVDNIKTTKKIIHSKLQQFRKDFGERYSWNG